MTRCPVITDAVIHELRGRMPIVGTILALLACLLSGTLAAQTPIYHWVDERGGVHFSDRPVAGAQTIRVASDVSWQRVTQVYDGDTVRLDSGMKVRLAGINTPEIGSRQRVEEPGAQAAKRWLERQLQQSKVRLVYDRERQDRYGRWLAYLFNEQGVHLNLQLVRKGLATVNLHPPNVRYAKALIAAQRQAERQRLGVWGLAAYQPRSVEAVMREPRRGWQRLRGQVQAIRYSRRYARLVLADHFDIRIPRSALEYFPPLERYLTRSVEVRGWVSRRKTHYSVLVRHPSVLLPID